MHFLNHFPHFYVFLKHFAVTSMDKSHYIHTEDKFKILNYLGDKQDSTGMGLRVQV
jgi:hypothetical protein